LAGQSDSSVMGSKAESDVVGRSRDCTANVVDYLRGGKMLLGHVAVLFVATMVGLTTAHVQISTRLLFSTSPMLYWYLASVIFEDCDEHPRLAARRPLTCSSFTATDQKASSAPKNLASFLTRIVPVIPGQETILRYCLVFHVLGILLHPNWLPWT
jgi:Mannosyltransferase (PIG-V)